MTSESIQQVGSSSKYRYYSRWHRRGQCPLVVSVDAHIERSRVCSQLNAVYLFCKFSPQPSHRASRTQPAYVSLTLMLLSVSLPLSLKINLNNKCKNDIIEHLLWSRHYSKHIDSRFIALHTCLNTCIYKTGVSQAPSWVSLVLLSLVRELTNGQMCFLSLSLFMKKKTKPQGD